MTVFRTVLILVFSAIAMVPRANAEKLSVVNVRARYIPKSRRWRVTFESEAATVSVALLEDDGDENGHKVGAPERRDLFEWWLK